MSEPFEIWCVKWCLNKGIEKCTAAPFPGRSDLVVAMSGTFATTVLQSREWYRTRAEAVAEANRVLRQAKISARNRVEELESISFEEVEHAVA